MKKKKTTNWSGKTIDSTGETMLSIVKKTLRHSTLDSFATALQIIDTNRLYLGHLYPTPALST